jgi:hypothetical protein
MAPGELSPLAQHPFTKGNTVDPHGGLPSP